MKVKIKTLGCKVNFVESLALEERLRKAGFEIADSDEEICDVFILNSCSVTNESDKKSRQALSRNRKINPDNYSVIMGCYSQVSKDELLENKNVNLVVGNKDKLDISYLMTLDKDKGEKVYDISKYREFEDLPLHGTGEKTRGFIKIEDGCDNFCSYCIIPYARGRVRSRSIESIKKEASSLGETAKEIVITGIEVASYGKDLKDATLIDAIEAVHAAAPNVRIRLSSLEISVITDDFLRRLKSISRFCDQFHLSLQSGSDNVLKAMNRKYNKETFKKKVDLIRSYYPSAGITTDIIVGFPGETEEDHESTVQYLKDLKLSRIHIFPYSIRKGTKAADMEQVDGNIKIRRKNELEKLGEELQEEFKNSLLNEEEEVLIEERTKGFFTGYTRNYVKAEISCDEYPDLKLNSVINTMLVEEKGEKKWIVCSAK